MSPILVLTGLLALAYIGSMLVGGRTIRGFGLPSGSEFVVLGIFLGPRFMGVFTRQGLETFDVIALVAVSWLAFVTGSDYGYAGAGRRVAGRRMLAGLGLATMTAILSAIPTVAVAYFLVDLPPRELLIFGLGVGAVSVETTRHAMRWVVQRYQADGPLTRLITDVAEADDALPILLLALLATIAPTDTAIALPGMPWSGLAVTLLLGAALGATCAALFDIEPRNSQRWGILLGTGLLCVGVSLRLDLSAVSAMFVMGLLATGLSKERTALQHLLATTERAVMLPALVLAGAYVVIPQTAMPLAAIVAAAIIARLAAKLLAGRMLARSVDASAPQKRLGLGLLPSGVLSIAVGLAFELRVPGRLSEWVLVIAVVHALIGEIVGTGMLRRALRIAGEISDASAVKTPLPVRVPIPTAAQTRAAARLIRSTTGKSRSGSSPGITGRRRAGSDSRGAR